MKKLLYILSLTLLAYTATAQQENTLYLMDRIPYASTLNPAMTPQCRWYLGGLMMPVIGQLPPSMYVSATMPFAYDEVIFHKEKDKYGNMKTAFSDTLLFDKFKKDVRKQNMFSIESDLPILIFGFQVKQTFWTFSMTEKLRMNTIVPRDMILLPFEGNGEIRNADLSGLAFNAMAYREYALGFNQQIDKYLRAGVRLKYLSAYYNIYTEQSNFKIITDVDNNQVRTEANMIINTSLPIDDVTEDEDGNVEDIEWGTPSSEDITKKATFSKNWGVALDFGLKKDFNSEITTYASVVDVGFVNWKDMPHSFVFEGSQELKGLTIDSINFAESFSNYSVDSLFDNYQYRATQGEYTQWLPFKVYLGADYKLRKWVKFGLLYRGEYIFKHLYNAYTLSANFNYMKFSSTSISYTIKNGNYANVGLGTTFRMGPFHTFFVADNIGAALWWYKSELFAFRMGTTLVLGVTNKKKAPKSVPLLNLYN